MKTRYLAMAALVSLSGAALSVSDEIRYFEEGGITYRESRRVVQRPITETSYETREQTVYREQLSHETLETQRTCHLPVTEYRWEAYWANRWNPFGRPYVAYKLVPHTTLEPRVEIVRTPVSRRELIPEKRVVQVPVTTLKMANEEVISRVAVSSGGSSDPFAQAPIVAQNVQVGGIVELNSDPPRYGRAYEWRPSRGLLRR